MTIPMAESTGRIESLDVFRGMTMAAMLIVNNPGSWSSVYPPLLHADWHGLTPTDLVFPFFLFIVGVCIPLSLRRFQKPGVTAQDRRQAWTRILRRSVVIFLIGLLVLQAFPWTTAKFASIRIPGVLQRIAVCYLIASGAGLMFRTRGLVTLLVSLLIGYWLLLSFVPAPGFSPGDLSREGSLPSWVDRTVLAGHTWKPDYDPEGLLSTLPAIATCLTGLLAGQWVSSGRPRHQIACGLFAFGVFSGVIGFVWSLTFPLNKALWTSSFVLVTSGFGLLLLATCYWLIDIQQYRIWSGPFRVLGTNALLVYVLSSFSSRLLGYFKVAASPDRSISVQLWLYEKSWQPRLSPENASLAWALSFLLCWLLFAWVLDVCKVRVRA